MIAPCDHVSGHVNVIGPPGNEGHVRAVECNRGRTSGSAGAEDDHVRAAWLDAHVLDGGADASYVGVGADQTAPIVRDRVDRSGAQRFWIDRVEAIDHCELVRDGDVRSRNVGFTQSCDGGG
jgi:hypothetical protein